MDSIKSKLTVFFEEPFWVGLYECEIAGRYEAGRIIFGAEPKDCEVYEVILKNWSRLRLSPSIEAKSKEKKRINPKRMQRAIKKQLEDTGLGTKAQQALKLQHEQNKLARKTRSLMQKEAEKERKFELKQEKRKQKHRGH